MRQVTTITIAIPADSGMSTVVTVPLLRCHARRGLQRESTLALSHEQMGYGAWATSRPGFAKRSLLA